jgi:MerR family transcriptional regulator, copper efflux regulator
MSLQRSSEKQRDQKRLASGAEPLTIGQLARLTGIHAKAIRYYESIGVLPRPARQSNGYRRYGHADVNRLILLRRLLLLGVSLATLTPLLVAASDAR